MSRPYVRHHWIAHGPEGRHGTCFVCGIGEAQWKRKIENDSMLNWDCQSVRERAPKRRKK
jgi:hypothetical protein